MKRKYEFPYNFDKALIHGYQLLNIQYESIDCIYIPPFFGDYETISRRSKFEGDQFTTLTYEEYIDHIQYINRIYPNKLQLLLQRVDGTLMPSYLIKKYIGLGIKNFCVGTIDQAKIIKDIDPTIKVVGSIAMHITSDKLLSSKEDYLKYFDAFVLDFSFNKNFLKIKKLPKDFNYMLLINSRCNINCDGDRHWWGDGFSHVCPGISPEIDFSQSCIIRPMDLELFDPYISVYKFQDRGWPTNMILEDVSLYIADYNRYMGPYVPDPMLYQTI